MYENERTPRKCVQQISYYNTNIMYVCEPELARLDKQFFTLTTIVHIRINYISVGSIM